MTRKILFRQTTPTHFLSRPLAKTVALLLVALGLALPVRAQTPVVEAKNADETTVLRINEDGGLLGLGVFGTGVTPAEGAGTRLVWHPAKAAFRAGSVGVSTDGSKWDAANVGNYSVAFGQDTEASGRASTAMGAGTTASGLQSTAMGAGTTASGGASTVMGQSTRASGAQSTAMGLGTTASGFRSAAMGQGTVASGLASTSMGQQTTAQAYASLVIGRYNVVAGSEDTWVASDPLFVAGNGLSRNPSNALTLFKDGNLTIAGDLAQNSDRRLKTAIVPLGDVLAPLASIQPVRYRFRKGTNRPAGRQLGLIAQEVQAAFPELVSRSADGYLSVAYPKLTTVLLRGLQEQQTQIETLEARLVILERNEPSPAFASMSGAAGATALLALLLLGGLVLCRHRVPVALPIALLVVAAGVVSLGATPVRAQTMTVQNGATLHVVNGGVLNLHGSTLDFGPLGETAQLVETSGGRVTGGLLTATRSLSAASGVDVAGLGLLFTADQALDAVTVTRGHAVQQGGPNQSIQRYYDLAPVPNGMQPESFDLTLRYVDAELGPLPEGELELFYSTDEGATWQGRGLDNRNTDANTVTLEGIPAISEVEGRWTLGASSQPLPVELTAFEAALDDGEAVRLTWTTASETNNAGFHIERAQGDGRSGENTEDKEGAWQTVGYVEGSGTTRAARSYRFRDAALPFGAGHLRYRLRQVDLDGTTSFGPEVEVQLDAPERVVLHAPYPNPLAERATVRYELPRAARVRLAVYNTLGQRMAVLADEEQPSGRKEIALAAWRWPSGMYFVRLEAGGVVHTRTLTVVR